MHLSPAIIYDSRLQNKCAMSSQEILYENLLEFKALSISTSEYGYEQHL
jgi:hypothetical protein